MIEQSFEVRFKLAEDELQFPEPKDGRTMADIIREERAFLTEYMLSIRGIETNIPGIETEEQLIAKLLSYAPYRRACYTALMDAHSGRARAKN